MEFLKLLGLQWKILLLIVMIMIIKVLVTGNKQIKLDDYNQSMSYELFTSPLSRCINYEYVYLI